MDLEWTWSGPGVDLECSTLPQVVAVQGRDPTWTPGHLLAGTVAGQGQGNIRGDSELQVGGEETLSGALSLVDILEILCSHWLSITKYAGAKVYICHNNTPKGESLWHKDLASATSESRTSSAPLTEDTITLITIP